MMVRDKFSETMPASAMQDGFALASVLLVIVVISIAAVPLLDMVTRNRDTATKAQIQSHLYEEAREALELTVYQVKLAKGYPAHFRTGADGGSWPVADTCTNRIAAVDQDLLNRTRLTADEIRKIAVSISSGRQIASFVLHKQPTEGVRFDRYVVVACARATSGEIGVYATEIAIQDGIIHVLKTGRF
jgi:type II secretory pathway pseudopilin PulG